MMKQSMHGTGEQKARFNMGEKAKGTTLEEQLLLKIESLQRELEEARVAVEHNRHVVSEEQLKNELMYRDGVIYGMKYALKCNGISGAEVDKRERFN